MGKRSMRQDCHGTERSGEGHDRHTFRYRILTVSHYIILTYQASHIVALLLSYSAD